MEIVLENVLIVGEQKIEFKKPIEKILTIGDSVIVLLKTSGNVDDYNNIYCVKNQSILWQVQDFEQFNPKVKDFPEGDLGSYVSIEKVDNSKVIATTFSNHVFSINIETGSIIEQVK